MNVKQAKEYIKHSVQVYLKKDEFGEYKVPIVRQRPIFLLGAPGIGKTAIMEQIAQELGIALVSYSMTHHTRQSALGLPFISRKVYGGKEYSVSEYTMSEIIASVYDTMEESGISEGILFLDEINCVSETLAPSMLQFLQYKVFGRHRVPDGWVVVTAGNPPEYNKSVREFDVVTMDRLKVLTVEAEYDVWREYAANRHVHSAVLSYLDLKKDHFYVMEMTAQGRSYVTARGWEDLSEILYLYEEEGLSVTGDLIGQYIHNEKVVKEFSAYYDLYQKYKKDYRITEILEGKASQAAIERAQTAAFDERLSLLGMLLDSVQGEMTPVMETADLLTMLQPMLKAVKEKALSSVENDSAGHPADSLAAMLEAQSQGKSKQLASLLGAGAVSDRERRRMKRCILFLDETAGAVRMGDAQSGQEAFAIVKDAYDHLLAQMKDRKDRAAAKLHYLFAFAELAFAEGNEMLLLVTQLTVGDDSSRFIGTFGSEDYKKFNSQLMLSRRGADILQEIKDLGI